MRKMMLGFLIGAFVMVSGTVLAQEVKQYMMTETVYPIFVEGKVYEQESLPILNYEGHTYVPLRTIGNLLSVPVVWNTDFKRVEIGGNAANTEEWTTISEQNDVFRKLQVTGRNGEYKIKGEAKVPEGKLFWSISDGHNYLLEDNNEIHGANSDWSSFEIDVTLTKHDLPYNGTLILELYEGLDEKGFRKNLLFLTLEQFVPAYD